MGCGTQIMPNFNEYNKMYKEDNKAPALEMKMTKLLAQSDKNNIYKPKKKPPSKV